MPQNRRILYCRCRNSQAVPADVRDAVLNGLADSSASFDAVGDLCGLAARGERLLGDLAAAEDLRIAGCHPRAVRLLFASAGMPLDESRVQLADMRKQSAAEVLDILLGGLDTEAGA